MPHEYQQKMRYRINGYKNTIKYNPQIALKSARFQNYQNTMYNNTNKAQ